MKLPVDFLVRLLTMIFIYIYKVCGEVIKESI